ncbi:MAG: hypothetical protein LC135_10410, partial [Phycisphaerae bacterium]|nr:hypothetical protein [Phycisphaerae bacterium]MCZ2400260.1 hypothetical protein [Phycisphaerae bacterium]
DRDGDGDLFYSQRIWQNNTTTPGDPSFTRLDENVTGVPEVSQTKEEGTVLADLDMDGDLDLVQATWAGSSVRAVYSLGDGAFSGSITLDAYGYGVSAVDWDNDGDIDVTAGGYFWRNRSIETAGAYSGTSMCWVQIYNLDDATYGRIEYALPSWLDADRDGDLDCARGAWGSGAPYIRFERNRLYHGGPCATCEPKKRYVNVRPVRAALAANGPNGIRDYTENESGALVELVLRNDPDPNLARLRRVQFTCTGSGYLNQNEYQPHFGLPPDPEPNDPNADLHFDVYVDFLTKGNENWRVDWTVNPQLADINLAELYADCNDVSTWGRPITVYRDGRVLFRGSDPNVFPADPNIARLYTLGGPLALPAPDSALPDPISANVFAGVRFNKEPNSPELRVREFIVDGQLDQTISGCAYNLVVLDMTDPNNPALLGGLKGYTFQDNRRTFIHVPPQDPNDPNDPFILPACDSTTTRTYEVRARGRTRCGRG